MEAVPHSLAGTPMPSPLPQASSAAGIFVAVFISSGPLQCLCNASAMSRRVLPPMCISTVHAHVACVALRCSVALSPATCRRPSRLISRPEIVVALLLAGYNLVFSGTIVPLNQLGSAEALAEVCPARWCVDGRGEHGGCAQTGAVLLHMLLHNVMLCTRCLRGRGAAGRSATSLRPPFPVGDTPILSPLTATIECH